MISVLGCRFCGASKREHMQRWDRQVGWHGYTPPTAEVVTERMWKIRGGRPA